MQKKCRLSAVFFYHALYWAIWRDSPGVRKAKTPLVMLTDTKASQGIFLCSQKERTLSVACAEEYSAVVKVSPSPNSILPGNAGGRDAADWEAPSSPVFQISHLSGEFLFLKIDSWMGATLGRSLFGLSWKALSTHSPSTGF